MRTALGTTPAVLASAALALLALGVAGCGTGGLRAVASADAVLERAGARGPDPFTASATRAAPTPLTRTEQPLPEGEGGKDGRPRLVAGDTPGLYAGLPARTGCDARAQSRLLTADRPRATAFARAAGTPAAGLDRWLDDLTPVVLRADTVVTAHGYAKGDVTTYRAVLQSGTAVLVDARGVPRVRCACGNPLGPAGGGSVGAPRGERWKGYEADEVRAVAPAARPLSALTLADPVHGHWLERPVGDDGGHDRAVREPSASPSAPPSEPPDEEPSPESSGPWETVPPSTDPGETPTEGGQETARSVRLAPGAGG
ncbi:DUF6777 domain-containing protein [Streptomyces sp. NPDC004959]|uniref:DUF6777 domain-containing protein n=1 Tax=unclassified Streptomyces TaxID=2593676 RepID=UPI000B07B49F|nr:DUF6777 domain-containing protein [Streptomyces sp. NRRL F-5630]